MVIRERLELSTIRLEGGCSIQLSYRTIICNTDYYKNNLFKSQLNLKIIFNDEYTNLLLGRVDSSPKF